MSKRKLHHWLIGMASGVLLLGQVLLAPSCFAQMMEALSDEELDGVSAGGLEVLLSLLEVPLAAAASSGAATQLGPAVPQGGTPITINNTVPSVVNTGGGAFSSLVMSNAQNNLSALVNANLVNSNFMLFLNVVINVNSHVETLNNLNQLRYTSNRFLVQ